MNATKTIFVVAAIQTAAESLRLQHLVDERQLQLAQTEGLFGSIGNWFNDRVDDVEDGFNDAVDTVGNGINDAVDAVGDALSDAEDWLSDAEETITNVQFRSPIVLAQARSQGLFGSIGNFFEDVGNTIADEIEETIEVVEDWGEEVVSDIEDWGQGVGDDISNTANSIAQSAEEAYRTQAEEALQRFSALENFGIMAYQTLEDIANNVGDYTEEQLQEAIADLEQAHDDVMRALANAFSLF